MTNEKNVLQTGTIPTGTLVTRSVQVIDEIELTELEEANARAKFNKRETPTWAEGLYDARKLES